MHEGSYAANAIKHCVRPMDMQGGWVGGRVGRPDGRVGSVGVCGVPEPGSKAPSCIRMQTGGGGAGRQSLVPSGAPWALQSPVGLGAGFAPPGGRALRAINPALATGTPCFPAAGKSAGMILRRIHPPCRAEAERHWLEETTRWLAGLSLDASPRSAALLAAQQGGAGAASGGGQPGAGGRRGPGRPPGAGVRKEVAKVVEGMVRSRHGWSASDALCFCRRQWQFHGRHDIMGCMGIKVRRVSLNCACAGPAASNAEESKPAGPTRAARLP